MSGAAINFREAFFKQLMARKEKQAVVEAEAFVDLKSVAFAPGSEFL